MRSLPSLAPLVLATFTMFVSAVAIVVWLLWVLHAGAI
jgi:hypothetical protein